MILKKTLIILISTVLLLVSSISVLAQTDTTTTKTYYVSSANDFKDGQVVSIKTENHMDYAVLSTTANDPNLLGVVNRKAIVTIGVVDANSLPIITSGIVDTYVSDLNGYINQGDLVTSSPASGIAEKNAQSGVILGQALSAFTSKNVIKNETLTINGLKRQVSIGMIPISIGISNYQLAKGQTLISNINYLAIGITGKQTSFLKEALAIVIFLIGIVAFIYGIGVSSTQSIRSIGRNPLAKGIIGRSFFVTFVILSGILAITTVVSYYILKS